MRAGTAGADANFGEIVGTFRSPESLERAVAALTSGGWDRADLSILGQRDVLLGDARQEPDESAARVADDPAAARGPVVSDTDTQQVRALTAGMSGVIAAFLASGATILTGGTALAAIAGAAVFGGGAAAVTRALGQHWDKKRDEFLADQVDHGGIVLWVRLSKPEQEPRARQILNRCGATNIHRHDMPAETAPARAD